MIRPIQRLMKYPLLLVELRNATPPAHPDCRPLEEACAAVRAINVNINELKRRKDLGRSSAGRALPGPVTGPSARSSAGSRLGLPPRAQPGRAPRGFGPDGGFQKIQKPTAGLRASRSRNLCVLGDVLKAGDAITRSSHRRPVQEEEEGETGGG